MTTPAQAWATVTAGPVPDQVALDQLPSLQGTGATMTAGRVVQVTIPDTASGFAHRDVPAYVVSTFGTSRDPRQWGGGRAGGGATGQELPQARTLCAQATASGIACTVRTMPGRHSRQFAATAFADEFGWMSDRIGVL